MLAVLVDTLSNRSCADMPRMTHRAPRKLNTNVNADLLYENMDEVEITTVDKQDNNIGSNFTQQK